MKFAFILENEERFQKEIVEAIHQFDPKIQIRIFEDLPSFANWVKDFIQTGPAVLANAGVPKDFIIQHPFKNEEHRLALVISKVEFLGKNQIALIKMAKEAFAQKRVSTHEDPTSFVLTAFDDGTVKNSDFATSVLNNILFKPFDKLILSQHIICAVEGRHPPSSYTVANQKTSAIVEMLKDVKIESFSETGFVTLSESTIPEGAIAKYYGKPFISERQRSVFAKLDSCVPHPSKTKLYQCHFRYFGLEPSQVTAVRKASRNHGEAKPLGSDLKHHQKKYHIAVVEPDTVNDWPSLERVKERFSNIEFYFFQNWLDFYADLYPEKAWSEKTGGTKAFAPSPEPTLKFDLTGQYFLGSDSVKDQKYFGQLESEIQKVPGWLFKIIDQDQREIVRRIFAPGFQFAQLGEKEKILSICIGSTRFLVELVAFKKEAKSIEIKLKELGSTEAINWLKSHSRLPANIDGLILSDIFLDFENLDRFCEPAFGKVFLLSKKDPNDADKRKLGGKFSDIFFKPIDKSWMAHKLLSYFPQLNVLEADPITEHKVTLDEIIKAANPIKVTEISEAGFVMEYYRSIDIGDFREMVLWQPYEVGAPELLAQCNFSEPSKDKKGVVYNHFIFFGATDHFLKHIRVWIRDNYVLSKVKS